MFNKCKKNGMCIDKKKIHVAFKYVLYVDLT